MERQQFNSVRQNDSQPIELETHFSTYLKYENIFQVCGYIYLHGISARNCRAALSRRIHIVQQPFSIYNPATDSLKVSKTVNQSTLQKLLRILKSQIASCISVNVAEMQHLLVRLVKNGGVQILDGLHIASSVAETVAAFILPDEVVPKAHGVDDHEAEANEHGEEAGGVGRGFVREEEMGTDDVPDAVSNEDLTNHSLVPYEN